MPGATFHHTITVDAPPDAVWDQLQTPEIWRSLGPVQEVWDPVHDDGVLTGFSWSTELGGVTYEGTGTALNAERPDRYRLELDTSEMAGTIGVDLTAADGRGTNVDVTVELRSKGLLSSMFFPIVARAIGDGLPEQVEAMAKSLSG